MADIDIINIWPDSRIAALYNLKKEFNECQLCEQSNLQERKECKYIFMNEWTPQASRSVIVLILIKTNNDKGWITKLS